MEQKLATELRALASEQERNDVWHWPIEELAATRDSLEKAKEADDLLRHQPENAALSAIRDGELMK